MRKHKDTDIKRAAEDLAYYAEQYAEWRSYQEAEEKAKAFEDLKEAAIKYAKTLEVTHEYNPLTIIRTK